MRHTVTLSRAHTRMNVCKHTPTDSLTDTHERAHARMHARTQFRNTQQKTKASTREIDILLLW